MIDLTSSLMRHTVLSLAVAAGLADGQSRYPQRRLGRRKSRPAAGSKMAWRSREHRGHRELCR